MDDVDTLSAAFSQDPFFRFIEPDDQRRLRWMPWFMQRMVAVAEHGGVIDREEGGIALWFPPGSDPYGWRSALRHGLAAMPVRLGPAAYRRFAVAEKDLEAVELDTSHSWYLGYLAVHPDAQGRGLGRRLLERGLGRVDAGHEDAHLETNRAGNVRLYERFGFAVAGECQTRGVLPQWVMSRPRAGAGRD